MNDIGIGDRVRYEDAGVIRERIVVPIQERDATFVPIDHATDEAGRALYTRVAVAHYADPGVPMIAMTADRLYAIAEAADEIEDENRGTAAFAPGGYLRTVHETLTGMLSDAGGKPRECVAIVLTREQVADLETMADEAGLHGYKVFNDLLADARRGIEA
jgi:hypothetical protein